MATRHRTVQIPSGGRTIAGTLVAPDTVVPGVMLVHGWDGSQEQYLARAHAIAALGCICLTIDLRGHASDKAHRDTVTREDNLNDMLAAYDLLISHPAVDAHSIVVVGSSYGGYLAAVLSALRPVRRLALRAPALYKDDDWLVPKQKLDRQEIAHYRALTLPPDSNRALAASALTPQVAYASRAYGPHPTSPTPPQQKKSPSSSFDKDGQIPGDDLLSQDLSSNYHRRCSVSLPGSEWDRVVPPRCGHQRRGGTGTGSLVLALLYGPRRPWGPVSGEVKREFRRNGSGCLGVFFLVLGGTAL